VNILPRKKIELTREQVLKSVEYCNSWQEVADELGISTDILRRERRKLNLPKEISDIKIQFYKYIPEDYLDDILPLEDKGDLPLNYITIEVPEGTKEVMIVPFGDIHWGNEDCDKRMLRIVLDWLYKNKHVYIICMGDMVESSIIGSPGLFDQEKFLDSQVYDIIKMLKPLADEGRIIGMHIGNHERRTVKNTSFNLTRLMCEVLDVKYLGEGILHLIEVTDGNNSEEYTMYTTHGASGALYPYTKMSACMKLDRIANAEVYCMGHVHSLGHQKMDTCEVDFENKKTVKKPRHYVLTGSYLKYWGSYAQAKSYIPSGESGSPKIKLHIDTHRISVSL